MNDAGVTSLEIPTPYDDERVILPCATPNLNCEWSVMITVSEWVALRNAMQGRFAGATLYTRGASWRLLPLADLIVAAPTCTDCCNPSERSALMTQLVDGANANDPLTDTAHFATGRIIDLRKKGTTSSDSATECSGPSSHS